MNTFEQYIGRHITRILRLDNSENLPAASSPLAILVMFEENAGLFIGFYKETFELNYMTLTNLEDYYGTAYGETCLNELNEDDPLNNLVGQQIKSLQIRQPEDENVKGDTFIIQSGEYTDLVLITDRIKVNIFNQKRRTGFI